VVLRDNRFLPKYEDPAIEVVMFQFVNDLCRLMRQASPADRIPLVHELDLLAALSKEWLAQVLAEPAR
jgi:hypothetical protein